MTTFNDPREFHAHLETVLASPESLGLQQTIQLLHGCMHTLGYLIESQNQITAKFVTTMDVLNSVHKSWGHKLSDLYTVLEAGSVTAEQMNTILKQEVCGEKTGQ